MNDIGKSELERARVITLCGSSRFPAAFHLVNAHLSMRGTIVFSLGVFGHADEPTGVRFLTSDGDEQTKAKQALDKLHLRKIDISDGIFVINVGGYIGMGTKREIEYARSRGKTVEWLFPPVARSELASASAGGGTEVPAHIRELIAAGADLCAGRDDETSKLVWSLCSELNAYSQEVHNDDPAHAAPEAGGEQRIVEPRGCPTPGACSCLRADDELTDASRRIVAIWDVLQRVEKAQSVWSPMLVVQEIKRILTDAAPAISEGREPVGPDLGKVREALRQATLTLKTVPSWWHTPSQQVVNILDAALLALTPTEPTK